MYMLTHVFVPLPNFENRSVNKQLKIVFAPTNLLTDVLEPCCAMLTHRGGDLEVTASCPDDLVIMSDLLRLKQVGN